MLDTGGRANVGAPIEGPVPAPAVPTAAAAKVVLGMVVIVVPPAVIDDAPPAAPWPADVETTVPAFDAWSTTGTSTESAGRVKEKPGMADVLEVPPAAPTPVPGVPVAPRLGALLSSPPLAGGGGTGALPAGRLNENPDFPPLTADENPIPAESRAAFLSLFLSGCFLSLPPTLALGGAVSMPWEVRTGHPAAPPLPPPSPPSPPPGSVVPGTESNSVLGVVLLDEGAVVPEPDRAENVAPDLVTERVADVALRSAPDMDDTEDEEVARINDAAGEVAPPVSASLSAWTLPRAEPVAAVSWDLLPAGSRSPFITHSEAFRQGLGSTRSWRGGVGTGSAGCFILQTRFLRFGGFIQKRTLFFLLSVVKSIRNAHRT